MNYLECLLSKRQKVNSENVQKRESTVENKWKFLKKLKVELPYKPATPLLDMYPKEMKSYILKRYLQTILSATQ
jgi:hypothetical protein